jgi:hypothetical protein
MPEYTDVLLVTLPDIVLRYRERITDMPPLGLAYIKAYLNQAGISAKVLNLFAQKLQRYLDMDTGVQQVCTHNLRILGLSSQDHDLLDVAEFCNRIKQHRSDIKIMVGGYIGFSYEELLGTCAAVDYVVVGEGEETVPELVKAVLNGQDYCIDEIKGVAYRKDGKIRFTGERARLKDINNLLPPDLSDTPPYKIGPGTRHHVVASRGCFNKGCSFCSTEFMYPKYMVMSPKKLADDIEIIYKQYPDLWCIALDDDAFDLQRLSPVMDELAKRGMGHLVFQFETTTLNIIKNRDILEDPEIKQHIVELHLGIESFNREQLEEYNKRVTSEENWEAVEICHGLGINFIPYIIVDRTPQRLESAIPQLTHPMFWPRWEAPQPLMNHPITSIAAISRQRKKEAPKFDTNEIKERIEKLCRPVWDAVGKIPYNMEALKEIQERQKKRSKRLNVEPWQEAFCTIMGPWFGNAERAYDERERLTAMAQMNKEQEERERKNGNESNLKHYHQEVERYGKAVERINALPEKFVRFALDVGRVVEMGGYDIYSTNFGDVVFAGEQLFQREIDSLLDS